MFNLGLCHLEFHDLMEMDETSWPRCLLWHGWLPLLSGVNGGSPWAQTPAEGLSGGIFPARFLSGGCLLILMLRVRLEGLLRPDVRIDGRLVDDRMFGASSAGVG